MSFIIRHISHTAEGREIIRSTTHDAPEILVGRDAACAIHLADLAVDLRHARITALSPARIRVEALGSLGFDVDGRSVQTADVSITTGAELRFGGHRLTVAAEGAETLITVARVAALSESSEERDVQTLYTLKGKLPSRRFAAWALFLVTLTLFLAWPIYTYAVSHGVKDRGAGFHADQTWTAGPLSQAHKGLAKNCQACHVNKFEAVQDKACVACHTKVHDHADVHRQLRAKGPPGEDAALKARFGKAEGRCVDCHNEHLGAGPMAQTPQKFCADCHMGMKARLPDTKLGDVSDFGTNHPNFKPELLVNPETGAREKRSMDGPISQFTGLKFPHALHLSATNGVARMSQTVNGGKTLVCKDCHTPNADGSRFLPISMEKNCQSCHSLAFERIGGTNRTLRHGEPDQVVADIRAFYHAGGPPAALNLSGIARHQVGGYAAQVNAIPHAWSGGAEAAVARVFSKGGACYDCHRITQIGGSYHVTKVVQPDHYLTKGWFNHAAHATESCASCHAASKSNTANDVLIPSIAKCRDCHVGADGAALKPVSTPTHSSCALCHDYHRANLAPWRARGKPYPK